MYFTNYQPVLSDYADIYFTNHQPVFLMIMQVSLAKKMFYP